MLSAKGTYVASASMYVLMSTEWDCPNDSSTSNCFSSGIYHKETILRSSSRQIISLMIIMFF